MDLRQKIENFITKFVQEYSRDQQLQTAFGSPVVGFADANSDYFNHIKRITNENHAVPRDILPDASLVISYYIPFTKELAKRNNDETRTDRESGFVLSAESWAQAYLELNTLMAELNHTLAEFVRKQGFHAAVPTKPTEFNTEILMSNWSQRHIAYAAGLGTFGMNNMLIGKKGCCGRYNSIVTAIPLSVIEPDSPMTEEQCRYKQDGSCGVCMKYCPVGALQPNPEHHRAPIFNRARCYAVCLKNDALYPGAEVCGKCVTSAACAFLNQK